MIDISSLESLRRDINVSRNSVTEVDNKEEYRITGTFPDSVVEHLHEKRLREIADAFGKSISLRVPSSKPCPDLINKGETNDRSEEWIERIGDEEKIQIELVIRKKTLYSEINTEVEYEQVYLYLFGWGVREALSKSIDVLDKKVFSNTEERHVFLVVGEPLYFSGPMLTIAGKDHISTLSEEEGKARKRNKKRAKYYRDARNHINWINFNLSNITPIHLLCKNKLEEESNFADSIRHILCSHLFQAGILFTANRSEQTEEGDFRSTYESSERTVTLQSNPKLEAYPDGRDLVHFVRWPFSGEHSDRLMILQNVIARSLQGRDEKKAVASLANRLADVLQEARWHFRSFIDDRIDRHFDRVERATSFANSVAAEIEQRISSMTKGLTDALLGAIGIVLGALLGTLVKGNTDYIILEYGMITYGIYLLSFHGLYRMSSIYDSFRVIEKDISNKKTNFKGQIRRNQYESIFDPIENRVINFKKWLFITSLIYVIVSLVLIFGAFQVPEVLLSSG